ncbi:MAG: GNAT family N-acetyltransferase [Erysipelotrichaceae bacterium]|nr:GNAT family N-acetyltransferase [Erysipelotrichaceae bacterium]MBR3351786.1 GNAT family N-acetyltransferase [Erysipelotrichaceae bacterium]
MEISIERVKDELYNISGDVQIYYVPDEDEFIDDLEYDQGNYDGRVIPLPQAQDINNYRMMEDFIEDRVTGEAREWLRNAIRGKGAFHRFRVTCERFGLLRDWYDYEEACYQDIAIYWCEENGIVYYVEKEMEKPEEKEPVRLKDEKVRIVPVNEKNAYVLQYMVIEFRRDLASYKDTQPDMDLESARAEIEWYVSKRYPVFAASISGNYVGYAVCKIEDDVVWLESIYVKKDYRRKGIATRLIQEAEKVAEEHGNETLYINIHPNNQRVIGLLKKNGYDVLNLIEVRKQYQGEKTSTEYHIGDNDFRY